MTEKEKDILVLAKVMILNLRTLRLANKEGEKVLRKELVKVLKIQKAGYEKPTSERPTILRNAINNFGKSVLALDELIG